MSRNELKKELKAVKKEVIQRERMITQGIIANSKIIFCTCVGASSNLLKSLEFDRIIIDEAAQGLESACWIPILRGKKVILAGDHLQLPPTIKCKEAEEGGLAITLFEKIITDNRFENITTLLNIQYRMNELISSWASENMYGGEVASDETVRDHTLSDLLPAVTSLSTTSATDNNESREEQPAVFSSSSLPVIPVLMMIDTANAFMYEDNDNTAGKDDKTATTGPKKKSTSHRNHNEAELILQHTLYLVKKGIKPSDIGIITPYNGQLELLRATFSPFLSSYFPSTTGSSSLSSSSSSVATTSLLLAEREKINLDGIEIKTIDGFQGGEKEVILISFVRSNENHNVGFLGENRRINVAITRAKRHLAIICDSETCSSDSFISTLLRHIEENGEIIPAEFYLSEFLHLLNNNYHLSDLSSCSSVSSSFGNQRSVSAIEKLKKDHAKASSFGEKKKDKKPLNNEKSIEDETMHEERNEFLVVQLNSILTKYRNHEITGGSISYDSKNKENPFKYQHLLSLVSVSPTSVDRPLVFPHSLNTFLRMKIHEIATSLSLFHESFGEKKKRYISVSLVPFEEITRLLNEKQITGQQNLEKTKEELKDEKEMMVEEEISTVVPEEEDEEEDVDVEENDNEEEIQPVKGPPQATLEENENKKKSKKKSKPKKKSTSVNISGYASSTVNNDVDEDALLNQYIEQNQARANFLHLLFTCFFFFHFLETSRTS
jgi:hypothetical protein